MWYKIYADGTELDIVLADSPEEAVAIVMAKTPDTCFDGVHWTYRKY